MSPDPPRPGESERGLRLIAPAKVNLALEVTGLRDDGYHDIDTVITTIDLADDVTVRPWQGLEVRIDGPYAGGIDVRDDLAGRAARALAAAAGREPDALIELTKRVPHPAGLGGGSSDAAAVLRGLNALWGLDWDTERLTEVAAELGSDVPFFLHGGAAHCTGRGELVEPLRDLRPLRLLVLVPPVPAVADKTARRYGALTPADFSSGAGSRRLAHRLARGAPPPTGDLFNVFEAVIERGDSELVAHYAIYGTTGALRLHLCGAGPAVCLFVRDDAKVAELRRDFRNVGAEVFEAVTLGRAAALAIDELRANDAS